MVSSPTIARSARTLPVVRGEAALAVVVVLIYVASAFVAAKLYEKREF